MALAAMAGSGPLSPRRSVCADVDMDVGASGETGPHAGHEGGREASQAGGGGREALAAETAGAAHRASVRHGEDTAVWEDELVDCPDGAAEEGNGGRGWVAAAAGLAAAPLVSAEDLAWSSSTLKSLESIVEASETQKLLPAGRILWVLRPYSSDADGTTAAGQAGEGVHQRFRAYQFKGPRAIFGKVVFTRSMLTDHMPMSYIRALEGEAPDSCAPACFTREASPCVPGSVC
jgi:hypothetical protein